MTADSGLFVSKSIDTTFDNLIPTTDVSLFRHPLIEGVFVLEVGPKGSTKSLADVLCSNNKCRLRDLL